MNSLFNQTSGSDSTKELLPDGTLAFAVISLSDKGLANSQSTGGEYANLVITLEGDKPVGGRKIFHMLANPLDTDNSEAWRKMSISAITRILEACGVFDYGDPESYKIFDIPEVTFSHMLEQIAGQSIAVEVGIDKGKDGYDDKNVIKTFLTPSQEKSSKRGRQLWDLLGSGVFTSKVEKKPIVGGATLIKAPGAAKPAVVPAAAARAGLASGNPVSIQATSGIGGGIGGGSKPAGGIGAPKWANRPATQAKPAEEPAKDGEPPPAEVPAAEPEVKTEVAPVTEKKGLVKKADKAKA